MFLRYSLRHLCVCSLSLMRLQSDFMLHLNQILNLLIAEKLYLHSADVTANVQPILGKSNIFGNFCLSQTLMARRTDDFVLVLPTTLFGGTSRRNVDAIILSELKPSNISDMILSIKGKASARW